MIKYNVPHCFTVTIKTKDKIVTLDFEYDNDMHSTKYCFTDIHEYCDKNYPGCYKEIYWHKRP